MHSKQSDEIVESREGAILTEKPVDNSINGVDNKKKVINNDIIGEMVQDQRADSDTTEKERTNENQEAGGRRRREMDKNDPVGEKRGDDQTSGARSKRTYRHYDKRRSGQGAAGRGEEGEIERRREESGRYRGRGNERQDRNVWRGGGESNGHYRGKQRSRDYQRTSDGAGKGYQQEPRGERSNRARQGSGGGGGGRTHYHKSNAYSAKDQSVPRRQREKRHREDAMPPAPARTGDAGVRLKIRDSDT